MTTQDIARRTVAFFFLKSAVNFVAVAVVGTAMWLGVGPDVSVALTLLPAARRGWTNLGDPFLHPQVTP
jgi:hypothetical protein